MIEFNWKEIFRFSRTEKIGAFVLIAIIAIEIAYLSFAPFKAINQKISEKDKQSLLKIVQNFNTQATVYKVKNDFQENDSIAVSLHPFDPNTATYENLLSLGFSGKTAHTIINFRNAGGKFYQKSDLKKIYGISAAKYNQLLPFINLPSDDKQYKQKDNSYSSTYNKPKKYNPDISLNLNTCTKNDLMKIKGLSYYNASGIIKYRKYLGGYVDISQLYKVYGIKPATVKAILPHIFIQNSNAKIDINALDSLQLININGISPFVAKNILNFRRTTGGFVSKEQVAKIYGLDSLVLAHLLPRIVINLNKIKKININTATKKELYSHALINYKTALKIVNYRDLHGKYANTRILLQKHLLSSELYRKIAPYLTVK